MSVTIAKCRKILGKTSELMSDDEIDDLLNQLGAIAEIVINISVAREGSTRQPEVIDSSEGEIENGEK